MSLHTKLQLLLNIAQGLRHLHGCGIVHLDVKPFNIVVTRGLIPKIIDFGDSYHKEVCSKSITCYIQTIYQGSPFRGWRLRSASGLGDFPSKGKTASSSPKNRMSLLLASSWHSFYSRPESSPSPHTKSITSNPVWK